MIWRKQSKRLKEVLGLKGHPIAVVYTMNPAKALIRPRFWVCEALKDARDGEVVVLTSQSSACMSGSWHLGLVPPPAGDDYKELARFLVESEKLCATYAAVYRMTSLITRPPHGLGDCVIISPLDKATRAPDAVVFIVNPEQASRLVTLATFETGVPPKMEMYGPTCHQVIAYPISTGEINVSVMDITSRKRYDPDELFVTIPGHLLSQVSEAIDKSTAGIAPFEALKEMPSTNVISQDYPKPENDKKKSRGRKIKITK